MGRKTSRLNFVIAWKLWIGWAPLDAITEFMKVPLAAFRLNWVVPRILSKSSQRIKFAFLAPTGVGSGSQWVLVKDTAYWLTYLPPRTIDSSYAGPIIAIYVAAMAIHSSASEKQPLSIRILSKLNAHMNKFSAPLLLDVLSPKTRGTFHFSVLFFPNSDYRIYLNSNWHSTWELHLNYIHFSAV